MNNKAMKRAVATALATTMVFGGAMTAFAEGTAVEQSGTGTFEGVEPEYPAVQGVQLPLASTAANYFNYTADPAGLMRKYGGSDMTGKLPQESADTGIYFGTADSKYAANSQALKVTNKNARDIDVKVKVEVTSESYDDMTFAESGTWESTDKKNEIYLAVVEKDADPANVAVVSADKAANLTIKIPGKEDNYQVTRTVGDDGKAVYAYAQKTGELTWNETEFYLTGAINKNAVWKDGTVTAPNIKVTWDYAAHVDAYVSATTVSTGNKSLTLTLPENVTVTGVVLNLNGSDTTLAAGNHYSVSGTTITFAKYSSGWAGGTLKVKYSDNRVDTITCQ